MTETLIPRTPLPRLQTVWLVVHWWALLPCLYLVTFAIIGAAAGTAELFNVIAVLTSLVSTLIGAVVATRLARAGVPNATFIKGTSTVRVIAVAWLLLGFVLIWVPIIETLGRIDFGGASLADGLLGSLGTLSILAFIGPGYSEYREAMSVATRPLV